jgi:hypothetical protein
MSISVLRPGRRNRYQTACADCGCEWRYDERDVSWTIDTAWSEGMPTCTERGRVCCPDCGRGADHDEADIMKLRAVD